MVKKTLISISLVVSVGSLTSLAYLKINSIFFSSATNSTIVVQPSKSKSISIAKDDKEIAIKKKYTGIVGQVDRIAEQITVRIDNLTNDSDGSGVIVAKQGTTYYALTAKHVLCNDVSTPQCEPKGVYQIVTNDGVTHKLDYQTIEANQAWLDIAIFSFESSNNYAVATLGKYDPEDRWIFVSGFSQNNLGGDGKPLRLITGGKLYKEEREDFAVKETDSLTKSKGKGQDGLVYTNISYAGMSGGAVLDGLGRLIGINVGAELDYETGEGINLGLSLGESILDFLGYLQTNNINLKEVWLNVDSNPATRLNKVEKDSIKVQLLNLESPQDFTKITAWMNYGNQLWRYERFNEAIDAFKKVIAIDPNFDKAYYAIGLAHLYQGEWQETQQALKAFKKAIEINPNPYYYWRHMGSSYQLLRRYDLAIAANQEAIARNNQDFVLYLELGDAQRKDKRYEEALISYNKALKINPNHPWIYGNRGHVYDGLKQYEKAIADFAKAIDINPVLTEAYDNRGLIYDTLGKYGKAIADFTKAIDINPQYASAYSNRSITYNKLKQYERAIIDCTKAIDINPQFIPAYFNRAISYSLLKRPDRAVEDYTRAIDIDPQSAQSYYNRGIIYSGLRKYEKAIADFTKVIDINPQSADTFINRGVAYGRSRQYERAIKDFTKAIDINPQSVNAYNNRGITYIALNNFYQARKDMEEAARLSSTQGNAQAYQLALELLQDIKVRENKR